MVFSSVLPHALTHCGVETHAAAVAQWLKILLRFSSAGEAAMCLGSSMPSLEWCHVCRKRLNGFSSHNNICISSRNRRESIESLLGVGHHSYSLLEGDRAFQFCGLGNKAGETRR